MDYRPNRLDVIPFVVKNIIIINVLIFFATIVLGRQGIDLSDYLALYHWNSEKFRVWQLITHMFMHGNVSGPYPDYEGGIMHLFSNMFGLWMFGSLLENFFGQKRFLTFYLLCGLGAALIHLGVYSYELSAIHQTVLHFQSNPTYANYSSFLSHNHVNIFSEMGQELYALKQTWMESPMEDSYSRAASQITGQYYNMYLNQATVGASGAVFGILFGFGYLFPNTMIYLYFFFPMKAKYFIAIYALFELFAGVKNTAGDNVAHFAHLGGMLIAFIILKIWNKTNRKNFY
jgi:membrane associated rhomboid family serine protease